MAFCEDMKEKNPKVFAQMVKADEKRGIKPYKNRFDYAYRNAKIRTKDCRYTRTCRKYGGDCGVCPKAKKGR
jgi:hypothetical protein